MSQELRIGVGGMSCASCVARVSNGPAPVNLGIESATVEYLPDTVSRERIAQAIRGAGYQPDEPERVADEAQARQDRKSAGVRRDLMFAAAFTLPLVLISMGPMVLPGVGALLHALAPEAVWRWAELALATPVLLWAGRRFLFQGWAELRHLSPGMNSLVMVGSTASTPSPPP